MSEMSATPIRPALDCDPIEQQARQDVLDSLYLLDRRDDPAHPLHATYTGLAQQYRSTPEAA